MNYAIIEYLVVLYEDNNELFMQFAEIIVSDDLLDILFSRIDDGILAPELTEHVYHLSKIFEEIE